MISFLGKGRSLNRTCPGLKNIEVIVTTLWMAQKPKTALARPTARVEKPEVQTPLLDAK